MTEKRVPRSLERSWTAYGHEDPRWAILTSEDTRGNRWDHEAFRATGERDVARVMRGIEEIGGLPRTDAALDFGCGIGRLTEALGARFGTVDGVDVSPSMIELADEGSRRANVRYHVNARLDLRLFPDESFDLVVSLQVIQHIPKRVARQYLREFGRVLRPGGVAALQIPLEFSGPLGPVRFRARNLALRVRELLLRKPGMEMHAWSEHELTRLFHAAGMDVASRAASDAGTHLSGFWLVRRR